MIAVARTVLENPLVRLALAVAVLLALVPFAGQDPEAPPARAGHAHAGGHPLAYDARLGMYGHSDHVGTQYPFAKEALCETVPDRALAAGLTSSQNVPPNTLSGKREVVHLEKGASDAQADVAVDKKGGFWVAYASFRDGDENIYVRRRNAEGTWEDEAALTERSGPDFAPAIEVDVADHTWVVWSRQANDGSWPLVGRRHDGTGWNAESVLVPGKHYAPQLVNDRSTGTLHLVWENWTDGDPTIYSATWDGMKWSEPRGVSVDRISQRPAAATGPDGTIWLTYDIVSNRKYEIRLSRWADGRWTVQPPPPAIEGHRRRASLTVDRRGWVWLLPETEVIEPLQLRRAFNGQDELYNVRPPARAILVWNGETWKALPRGPAMSSKANQIHVDAKGTVWVFSRTPAYGAVRDFSIVVQRYRGSKWYAGALEKGAWPGNARAPRESFLQNGQLGSVKEPVDLIERDGSLFVVCHETHRRFTNQPHAWTYEDGPAGTLLLELPLEAEAAEDPSVVEYDPTRHGTPAGSVTPLPHATRTKPEFTAQIDDQEMGVYYGDMHHHTEFSRDPGVLNDDVDSNYRYIRFIRGLDFEGLADHAEHINPHDWYRIRRTAAFYNHGRRFSAMVASEWTSEFYRNGNYQEGHHNVVFRTDGPEVNVYSASHPRSNTPQRLINRNQEDLARAEENRIPANFLLFPHDPSRWVQPISWSWYHPRIKLLELVQSRGAHEIMGGPQKPPLRNDFQQQLMGKSAQDGLAKGFRWGFVGSGDHIGRPVAGVLSPAGDRGSIFDSLYARRTFATTGARMVVTCSVNGHRMGSEWRGKETNHTINIRAVGSKPITLVDLWKNGRLLWRWSPATPTPEFRVRFEDPSAPYFRENYWYARVMQEDGELAWSSPVWFIYEEIPPVVVADAGGPEPHYFMPSYPVPMPVLMRNQKAEAATGKLELVDLPEGWSQQPAGAIEFELPADSWTTYSWTVTAPAIAELKALPVKLRITHADGRTEIRPMTVIQSPKFLSPRRQLSELNDALYMQKDLDELNRWLKTMAKRWKL